MTQRVAESQSIKGAPDELQDPYSSFDSGRRRFLITLGH